jgi:hypothetical protein
VLPLQHHVPEDCRLLFEEHAQEPQGRGRKFLLSTATHKIVDHRPTQLCWSCSERRQNETLSSDESEGGDDYDDGGDDSDDTNPFRGTDVSQPLPRLLEATAANKIKMGNLSIGNDLSGGVPVKSSRGTIWGGGSSIASCSITTPSVSDYSGAPKIRGDDTPSITSFDSPIKKLFNPKNYGDPGLRPSGSSVVSSTDSPKGKTQWPRMKAVPSKVNSDAARQVEQHMAVRRRTAEKYADDDDVKAADSAEDSDDAVPAPKMKASAPAIKPKTFVPAPKMKAPAPALSAQTNSTFSRSDFQAFIADNDQEARDTEPITKHSKRQTNTDVSRQVYSQEEAYHEIADYSDGSLSDDSEGYYGVEVEEGFHG